MNHATLHLPARCTPGGFFCVPHSHSGAPRFSAVPDRRYQPAGQTAGVPTGPAGSARIRTCEIPGPAAPPVPESPTAANPTRMWSGYLLRFPYTDSFAAIFKWVRGELIGKGTYGRVYLALNVTTGEMIAVKQVEIPKTASDRDDSRQVS